MSPTVAWPLLNKTAMWFRVIGQGSDASTGGHSEKNKRKEALAKCVGLSMCLAPNGTATGAQSEIDNHFMRNPHFWDHPSSNLRPAAVT